jgi:hypothetical protein
MQIRAPVTSATHANSSAVLRTSSSISNGAMSVHASP